MTEALSRLAVLMPVYNDQAGLERSLASLGEDGAAFDVVAVDDGSTPPLVLPAGLPFRAVLLRLERNQGIVGALEAGRAHIGAAGHYVYVARLDAGDLSRPGRMAAQMAFLDAHPDHAVVGSAAEHVDPGGRFLFTFHPPAEDARVRRFLRYRNPLMHSAVMLRLKALEELGGYRARFAGAEDLELYLRLAGRYKLANLAPAFVVREVSPTSITSRRQAVLRQRLRALWHHFDARSPHAHLGLLSNLGFLLVPRAGVLWLHRLRERHRRGGRPGKARQP